MNVDVSSHLGDQDQELVDMVKSQMIIFLNMEMRKQNEWTKEQMEILSKETDKKI